MVRAGFPCTEKARNAAKRARAKPGIQSRLKPSALPCQFSTSGQISVACMVM